MSRRRLAAVLLGLTVGWIVASLALASCAESGGERPTLIYFRSEHWPFCKEMTPIVDGLRREYKRQLDVVYAEMDEADGKKLARELGAVGTPTILLLDSKGNQVKALRGSFPPSLIVQAIEETLAQWVAAAAGGRRTKGRFGPCPDPRGESHLPSRMAGTAEQVRRYGYLAYYYLGTLVGKKRPLLGGIKLTHQCNLSCVHCPFRRMKTPSLSFPRVVSAMDTLHDWGVRILILEGGEPFLWRDGEHDLGSVVAEAKRKFFTVGVTTNGTFPLEVASDVIWVSIDGLKETHDRIRGKSFEAAIAHIEASSHPHVNAHITVNSLNWNEVPSLVAFLSQKVKNITVQFHYPFPAVGEELCLSLDKRREVLDELISLKKQGYPLANSRACLEALKENSWTCRPWMIASVDPDGRLVHGCYLRGREEISCERCGFSAHTEISLAYGGVIEAMLVGRDLLLSRDD